MFRMQGEGNEIFRFCLIASSSSIILNCCRVTFRINVHNGRVVDLVDVVVVEEEDVVEEVDKEDVVEEVDSIKVDLTKVVVDSIRMVVTSLELVLPLLTKSPNLMIEKILYLRFLE